MHLPLPYVFAYVPRVDILIKLSVFAHGRHCILECNSIELLYNFHLRVWPRAAHGEAAAFEALFRETIQLMLGRDQRRSHHFTLSRTYVEQDRVKCLSPI